ANNWELNPDADMGTWYSSGSEGYIDFPTYQKSQISMSIAE
ncbi:MAG: alkene reductase, partial [Waterburya sp.]